MSKARRKCVELVEQMLSRGYRLQITSTEVERLIKIGVGADKRTVQKYIQLLTEDLGFLKIAIKNPLGIIVYRIDIPAIEKFLTEHLKEKLKQMELSNIRLKQEASKTPINRGGEKQKNLVYVCVCVQATLTKHKTLHKTP